MKRVKPAGENGGGEEWEVSRRRSSVAMDMATEKSG